MNGPLPIGYEQIKAWKELTETSVSSREVGVIVKLDLEYLRVANG
jgi:hypothetical protein